LEADSFFPSEFTNYEYIYNNENNIAQLQVPLALSYFSVPKLANDLYTDTNTTYFTYSGNWNSLIVSREKDGRYKNLSMRAYSGDSFKFYFSTGLGFSSGANYYSGPVTISGSYSKLTAYSGEASAIANAVTFSSPVSNSVVYTLPFVENINWIRLHHKAAVSGQSYRLYQFLPRTLIQVDDLEADVIDAVTIRVSDSIVIGPNLIGDKSILGQKIVDGTVSGILMTDGTITGSKVLARTISGILITAGTIKGENIEALTISGSLITANAITAGKIAAGTITFDKIASNTLTSGQIADGTITGQKIVNGTISGVLITNNSITASNIAGNTITGDKILAGTISGSLITAGTISSTQIATSGITAINLAANSITADKITTRVITADKIVISGITAELLGAQAVTAAALATGSVISGKIAADSIYGSNIIGGVITGYHVAANTITGDKIQANTISGALITAGTITFDKIASNTLTSGQIANGTITGQNILAGTVSGVLITNNSITASNIAGATITGDKIVARTISGALITAGTIKGENIEALTISGSLITAGTITATKLSVTQLDAVAANMGTLTVNSGISIGTNGTIWAGAGTASSPQTGLKIYTTSGISRLTTYASSGIVQVDIASNGKLLAGAGAVILDSAGLTAGRTVVNSNGITVGTVTAPLDNGDALKIMASGTSGNNGGISFYNGAYSAISPQATVTTDATNSFVVANNYPGGALILQNASTGNNSIYLYNSNVNIMPTVVGDVQGLYGYSRTINGTALKYRLNTDGLYLFDNNYDAGFNPVPNVILERTTGNITTVGDIAVSGNIHAGIGTHKFTVNGNSGNLQVGSPPHVFIVNGTSGNTTISGTLSVGSTLDVTGALTANNNVLQYNYGGLYKNTAQNVAAGADAKITFQVAYTNGTLDSVANSRLTTTYAGFYVISAGVIGNQTGNTWQVVTGGAFGTGALLAGIIQADMRAYVTKIVYLAAGTNLELYVRNTGANILAVTTGTTGTVLSAAKVG